MDHPTLVQTIQKTPSPVALSTSNIPHCPTSATLPSRPQGEELSTFSCVCPPETQASATFTSLWGVKKRATRNCLFVTKVICHAATSSLLGQAMLLSILYQPEPWHHMSPPRIKNHSLFDTSWTKKPSPKISQSSRPPEEQLAHLPQIL